MHTLAEKKLIMLKPDEILACSVQPRHYFDEHELTLLAESIAANGIIQPLTVRKTERGYELIAGERRLRAAKMAGLRRVPCVLHRADTATAAVYSITENLQRCDLSFFEEALAIEQLISCHGLSQTEAAARLGIAQSTLCNKLRLLRLSEEQRRRIVASGLTERHARALLRLAPEMRDGMLDRIIAQSLTLPQTEEAVSEALLPAEKKASKPAEEPTRKAAIGDIRLFANSLSKLLLTMQSAGFDAHSKKCETEKYIEYRVRINKAPPEKYTQLKIC